MKDMTMFKAALTTTKMVMNLFVKTGKTMFMVLIEMMKLMVQAGMSLTEWFYHTVVKVLKTTYSS